MSSKIFSIFSLLSITLLMVNFSKSNETELDQFSIQFLPNNVTDAFTEFFMKNFEITDLINNYNSNYNFLEKVTEEKEKSIKIPDYMPNALIIIAENLFKLEIQARNDSSNPLPLSIDSDSLSIIVDEFKKYQTNIPMSMRIYHDKDKHLTPAVTTDPQGLLLSLNFGIDFGIFPDNSTEPVTVLSFDLNLYLKIQLETVDNKFSLGMKYVKVRDIVINHDDLNVDKEKLKITFVNFINSAYDAVDEKLTDIDVLKMLNDFIGSNFTKFDILMDYGYSMVTIG